MVTEASPMGRSGTVSPAIERHGLAHMGESFGGLAECSGTPIEARISPDIRAFWHVDFVQLSASRSGTHPHQVTARHRVDPLPCTFSCPTRLHRGGYTRSAAIRP